MSVIGGQNTPVTNGLVYALDFGNLKSYSSGSTSAKSLQFNLNNFSVSGSPSSLTNAIELGTSKYLSQPNIFTFNPNQDFTIQITGRPLSSGILISTNTTSSKFILTYGTSSIIGFQTPTDTYTKQITGISTSSVSAITYRYRSGSFDFFVNGLPVSASANTPSVVFLEPTSSRGVNNYMFINGFLSLNSSLNTSFVSGSLSTVYFYNRALTSDEIYQNLLSNNTRSNLGLPSIKPYSLDENTVLYVSASGITNTTTVNAVDTFVQGLKSVSLWDKMVAIYPLISGSNNNIVNLKDGRIFGTASLATSGLSGSFVNTNITPSTYYPNYTNNNAHISILSYDTPNTQSVLIGTSNSQYASGGQIFYTGSNVIHVFTGSGYFRSYVSMSAQVMVVAGGGGGGNYRGAGGGAGGLVYSSSYQIPQGTYSAVIGLGGLTSNQSFAGQNGENSTFNNIVAIGGGAGGGEITGINGSNGGSGGGQGGQYGSGITGSGTPGQGNNAGSNVGHNGGSGGGGAGNSGSVFYGGSGSYFPQFVSTGFGSPAGWFAGGGAGSNTPGQAGGIGGGGNETTPGTANTGGGSGGVWNFPGTTIRGGSGIIIISYDTASLAVPSSSFSIYATETSISGAINNNLTSGIQTGGPLGLITVSRTGSNTYTLYKNRYPQQNNIAASSSLNTNLYLNALNFNNTASLISNINIAYASVGAGLTDDEVYTYYELVDDLQTSLNRGPVDPDAFITVWDTTKAGSASNTIILPLYGTQAITASWGDGTESYISSSAQADRTHSYAESGTYTVTITGQGQGFQFNNGGDKEKLMDIVQWGSIPIAANYAFWGCSNLIGTTPDYPTVTTTDLIANFRTGIQFNGYLKNWDVSNVTDFRQIFFQAINFNQDLNTWDVSKGTNFTSLFFSAPKFNQNIGAWNVEKATQMGSMFYGATVFNNGESADINNWRPISCSNFSSMFQNASAFNQPIGNWPLSASNISMAGMFYNADSFNQNIGSWNVEKVISMNGMFYGTRDFNNSGSSDINNWRPISCSDFKDMFTGTQDFNQPIGNWPLSASNINMSQMFYNATTFNQNLGSWDVSRVTGVNIDQGFSTMFLNASNFNNGNSPDINNWRFTTSSTVTMYRMFTNATAFNQNIGSWNVEKVINMSSMFNNADSFNQNIGAWNVEKVTNMSSMFNGTRDFNNSGSSDINNWRPISCSNFTSMFESATAFNQPIGNWPLSASNINMSNMFYNADSFNQNIGSWDVEKVISMNGMFWFNGIFNNSGSADINNWRPISCSSFTSMFQSATAFNQPIGGWQLGTGSHLTTGIYMSNMFYGSVLFNQDLGSWDVSKVVNMANMFRENNFNNSGSSNINNWIPISCSNFSSMFRGTAAFNQPLGNWDIRSATTMANMFDGSGIDIPNYTKTLRGWGDFANTTGVQTGVPLGASGKKYGAAHAQRKVLTDTYGWTITDGGQEPFVFTINTTASGYTAGTELTFTLPLTQTTYNGYNLDILVDWGDGQTSTISQSAQADKTHTYSNSGSYEITITGSLFGFRFNGGGDKAKLTDVSKWSAFESTQDYAFSGCSNLVGSATDAPLITTNSLRGYFQNCNNFNGAIGNWDVSSVTDMFFLFFGTRTFNQDLNNWDVSNVTDMSGIFDGNGVSSAFNGNITSWNTSNVTSFQQAFSRSTVFNQDISTKTVNAGQPNEYVAWDTSKVQNLAYMFFNATAFNQDIGNWNVSSCTSFLNFMDGKSAANYDPNYMDSIFNNWPNYKLKPNLTGVHFGSISYTSSGSEGKALLERPHITASISNIQESASLFQIQATSIVDGLSAGNRITISGSGNPVLDKAHAILQVLDINTFTVDVPFTASAIQGEVITGYGWTMITGSQI